ncbi:recombinase family protein [Megamonas hypermegale]|uniref:recombinase family protein n=1 Tax=Megamonas hypermegale TaxID=158847 RepID=UPI0026EC3010|nr:recombinase family protein [Megamonas hypermegale]
MFSRNVDEFLEEWLIYLRKSRSDNPSESVEETLARHEKELQEFAVAEFGEAVPERNVYREVVSGGEDIEDRPEFVKVLGRMEKGNIKGVLVVDTARLSRAGIYGAGDVINAFYYTNTLIVTPVKTYDLRQKFDKKFIEMEMLKSNDYLDYVKEVLGNGKMRSLRSGCFIGSETPFGYGKEKLDRKGWKLVPIESEAEVVRLIFDLYLEGLGTVAVSNYLLKEGVKTREGCDFSPDYVRRILTNEHYVGRLVWGKRKTVKMLEGGRLVKKTVTNDSPLVVDGLHEPLVSMEQFLAARERLDAHPSAKTPRTTEVKNPLAGLVTCKVCGRAIIRKGYLKSKRSTYKRVREPDKLALIGLLQDAKRRSGLSLSQIADRLGVTKGKVDGWLSPNPDRVYFSRSFAECWFDLKAVLGIGTDEFDVDITTYHSEPPADSLVCSNLRCSNVSSRLDIVEAQVLEALRDHLNNYHYFVDNYEEEITRLVVGNSVQIENLQEKISRLGRAKKNLLRAYNMEDISREEYLEEKAELEAAVADCQERLSLLEANREEDKLVKYKKAIPILERCLEQYDRLSVAGRNELLRSIVKEIKYSKSKAGRFGENSEYQFRLDVDLLI